MAFEINTAARGANPGRSLLAWSKPWTKPRPKPWARRRRAAAGNSFSASRARTKRMFSGARLIVLLAVIAIGVTGLSAGIGYGLARQSDEYLWLEQRASLRNAIAEFRNLFGPADNFEPRFVSVLQQSTGLLDLKFETEPALNAREMQPP